MNRNRDVGRVHALNALNTTLAVGALQFQELRDAIFVAYSVT
jgi:hypothetical protein